MTDGTRVTVVPTVNMSSSPSFIRRRPLIAAALGSTAAAGALGVASRTGLLGSSEGDAGGGRLELQATAPGLDGLDIRLGDDLLPRVGPGRFSTGSLPTTTHSMVGFTWTVAQEGAADPVVEVSSRVDGAWQPFRAMPRLHDLPDLDSAESTDVTGTELVWIGDSDGIRVRVSGGRPQDLTMVLLHPGELESDVDVEPEDGEDPAELATSGRTSPTLRPVARPTIISRKQWAADPRWRSGSPTYNNVLVQVHVHHTVSANSYSRAQVPGMIRGMYRYHTANLGWSDIGYNFLVDRFGRLFEGRAGGPAKLVKGAHTLGFNTTSTGISAIGNFETTQPTSAMLNAIASLAAWKLSLYGRNPTGRTSVRSEGSDRFGPGRVVSLPVIDGHRDTNQTACPGINLYTKLPNIRQRTKRKMNRASQPQQPQQPQGPQAVTFATPYALEGAMTAGATLRLVGGSVSPKASAVRYQWRRNGTPIPRATGSSYVVTPADVGSVLSVKVAARSKGLDPAISTFTAATRVRALAKVTAKPRARKDRAVVVRVRVEAPGSSVPATGTVTVKMSGRVRTGTLKDGVVVVRFLKVPPGKRAVRVLYPGDARTSPGHDKAGVSTR